MGPGVKKCHNMHQNQRKMSRKNENVKSPKMDSPDLIPEGLGGAQGALGDPWEPLKSPKTPKNPENPKNQKNPKNPEIPPLIPY